MVKNLDEETGEQYKTIIIGGKKIKVPVLFVLPEEHGEKEIEAYEHPEVNVGKVAPAAIPAAVAGTVARGVVGGVANAVTDAITGDDAEKAADSKEEPLDKLTDGKLEEVEKEPQPSQQNIRDEGQAILDQKVPDTKIGAPPKQSQISLDTAIANKINALAIQVKVNRLIENKADENKPLNKPMRDDGNKKFKVYVRDPKTGNIVTVRFGDPNMEIKRDDPERRASFRARHKCSEQKDVTSAAYWSCKMWEKSSSVSDNISKTNWEVWLAKKEDYEEDISDLFDDEIIDGGYNKPTRTYTERYYGDKDEPPRSERNVDDEYEATERDSDDPKRVPPSRVGVSSKKKPELSHPSQLARHLDSDTKPDDWQKEGLQGTQAMATTSAQHARRHKAWKVWLEKKDDWDDKESDKDKKYIREEKEEESGLYDELQNEKDLKNIDDESLEYGKRVGVRPKSGTKFEVETDKKTGEPIKVTPSRVVGTNPRKTNPHSALANDARYSDGSEAQNISQRNAEKWKAWLANKKEEQTTFDDEENVDPLHAEAKKRKKQVWDKARRDGIGMTWDSQGKKQ